MLLKRFFYLAVQSSHLMRFFEGEALSFYRSLFCLEILFMFIYKRNPRGSLWAELSLRSLASAVLVDTRVALIHVRPVVDTVAKPLRLAPDSNCRHYCLGHQVFKSLKDENISQIKKKFLFYIAVWLSKFESIKNNPTDQNTTVYFFNNLWET